MINVVITGYIKCNVVATPLALNLYPQKRKTADIRYSNANNMSDGIADRLIRKDSPLSNKMPPNASVANKKR